MKNNQDKYLMKYYKEKEKDELEAKYQGIKIIDYTLYKKYKNKLILAYAIALLGYFLFGILVGVTL